jgi:probable rRNA maturation factor
MKAEPHQRSGRTAPELFVRNLQRRHAIDRRSLVAFLGDVARAVGARDRSATLALVNDERIRALNREYRGFDKSTDVLSFPAGEPPVEAFEGGDYLGDIVVSVETAERQARRRGSTLAKELRLLTLHGFLHLLGYDHETDDGRMRRIEYRLRRRFRITRVRGRS